MGRELNWKIVAALLAISLCGWTHGSGGLSLTSWTSLQLGGGGNISGIECSVQDVCLARGDVFGAYILGVDNKWHQLATQASMPAANWALYPTTNTSTNQVYAGFAGVMEIIPCPSSASCAYMYAGGWIFYSNNISASNPSSITWCNTGGWTQVADTSNDVIGAGDPGQQLAIDPVNSAHVLAATPTGGLLETFTGTACASSSPSTWAAIPTASIPLGTRNAPNGTPLLGYTIAFDPTSGTQTCHSGSGTCSSKAYVFTPGGATPGVYATANAGSSWAETTGGPQTMTHLKVNGDAAHGGGNVWAVDASGNLWVLVGSTWTQTGVTGVTDVAINPSNGNHIAALKANLEISINGANGASATFNLYTATAVAGDAGWLSWAAIGLFPGPLTFNPATNDQLLGGMGQGLWVTSFPSGNFNWAALSYGIEGAIMQPITVMSAQTPSIGADDISGCTFTIAMAATTRSTCYPNSAYRGLAYTFAQSPLPGYGTLFAKIGPNASGATFDETGYSTDGFNSNYAPLNLWTATIAGTGLSNNGSGKVRATVTSTSGLNSWAAGDARSRSSIICVLANAPNTVTNGFSNDYCDEITVVDGTHIDFPNTAFISSMTTAGSYLLYVPAYALDNNFGQNTILTATNSSGLIQITGPLFQINFAAHSEVCISGVTGTTEANGCWVTSSSGYSSPITLLGSSFVHSYTGGGVMYAYGNAGGSIAAASASNIAVVNSISFPLCTADGGATWNYERVTGDVATAISQTSVGVTNAGATTLTLSGAASWTGNATVLLTSGRWLPISGTLSGTTLTFSPAIPTGDSLPSGSSFYNQQGTGTANAYYQFRLDLARDWVTPNTFYAVNANVGLIKWTNCGTPSIVAAQSPGTGWLTQTGNNSKLKTVPGQAGHMFFAAGPLGGPGNDHPFNTSLYRACNGTTSSVTMQRVPGFYEPIAFGFGAAASGQSYPTEYVIGWYSATDTQATATYGVWKSTNDPNNTATGTCNASGNTWANIATGATNAPNGFPVGWNSAPLDIEGDPFVSSPQPVYMSSSFNQYYGVFNYLLERDLDPGSNDNAPAFSHLAA